MVSHETYTQMKRGSRLSTAQRDDDDNDDDDDESVPDVESCVAELDFTPEAAAASEPSAKRAKAARIPTDEEFVQSSR
jgi:hypothetical protein